MWSRHKTRPAVRRGRLSASKQESPGFSHGESQVNQFGDEEKIAFARDEYVQGGDTFIEALCEELDWDGKPYWGSYASVTVNLPDMFHMEPNAVWVDDNNSRHLVDWMERQHLLRFTGAVARSGFCVYREAVPSETLLEACITYGEKPRPEPAEER